MGHRPPPADLREGPDRPGRPGRDTSARPESPCRAPGRLPPPRLHAGADRLQGQARHARPDGARGREALRGRAEVARGEGELKPRKKQGATGITTVAPYVAGLWGRGE